MSWEAPIAKYLKRAAQWGKMGLGMHMTLRAYKIYVASVLMFVAQFEEAPEEFEDAEKEACRLLFPGPHLWITPAVLRQLRAASFPVEWYCVRTMATAAQSRLLRCENMNNGGLRAGARAAVIRRKMDYCEQWNRLYWLNSWIHNAFTFTLQRADDKVEMGIRRCGDELPSLLNEWLRKDAQEGNGDEPARKRRRRQLSWQAVAGQILKPSSLIEISTHLNRRLRPLRLRCLPGHRVQRVLGIMARLSNLVAPRVQAAYWRTVCNGWCTSRRFGGLDTCRFGCAELADDITHYARCPVVASWADGVALLARAPTELALAFFLCMATEALDIRFTTVIDTDVDILKRRAWHLYSVYMMHNLARYHSLVDIDMLGAYRGFYREARLASD